MDLNKSLDNAMPKVLNGGARWGNKWLLRRLVILFLLFRFTTLPPLCPPIKEELPFPAARENGGPQHNSTPNILDMAEVSSTILISKSEKI